MHDDFHSLFAYNGWANRRILAACRQLSAEQYASEPAPAWSSVRNTVVHILAATDAWLRGLSGEVVNTMTTEADVPTLDQAEDKFDEVDRRLANLLKTLDPAQLATPVTLQGWGRTIVVPPWAVLRHLANHATYHRGQVASKLKRLGVTPPATDFIHWVMEQSRPIAS